MSNDDQPKDGESNPVGRPLKFKSVEALEMAIQLYFDEQDPHIQTHLEATGVSAKGETMFQERKVLTDQKPYTLTGLARALGVNRGTLLNYGKKEEFFSTIEAARARCAEYAETQLFGPYANGAKFALTNNYSAPDAEWSDKKAVDHTTKGQPMPLLAGTVELPSAEDGDDDVPPEA